MALIREDKHSLYAKVGGYIARPVYPKKYHHVYDDGTQYEVEQDINARHAGGHFCSVGNESWFIHGAYLPDNKPSEECWKL